MGHPSVRLRTLLAGLGAAAAAAALTLAGALEQAELATLDRLFEARGARPPAAPIVIVAIDEDSFDELDIPWPFPRALHGRLLDVLAAGRPLAVGFDILFPEPSARGPEDDRALGRAVARVGNVVLAAARTDVAEGFYEKTDLNLPIPVIRQGAAAVAPINLYRDVDAAVRRAPLHVELAGERVAGFDATLHRLAAAAGIPAAPLPAGREVLINFRGGPRTFPRVPYHRVVSGGVPPETFRGAIVLVGPTSETLHDVFPTPFTRHGAMPGVEIHANVLDMLIAGDVLREVPRAVTLALTAVTALAGAWLAARLRALRALGAVAVAWAALAAAVAAAFALGDLWLRGVGATLGLVLGYGAALVDGFVREQQEKGRLARFFSPGVLSEIVRHPREAALGSRRHLVTVLFADIRGFTSISERVEPEVVVEMLREYLTEMTEVVFRHGGTVDKYIGDCIMALYNVPFADPDHAAAAVATALEIQERTLAVSARWEARLGAPIRCGVGINTGEAVVGTIGSRQRLEYTAIGDTVNLASRMESLTAEHGVDIIVSEFTRDLVRDRFLTRELGAVAVRGRSQPVRMYAVLPADLRRYPRAVLAAAATVAAVGGGERCLVRAHDVGEGGLALVGVPGHWPVGSAVEVRCEGGSLPQPLVARGRVAWRQGERTGIAFTEVEPGSVPAIAGLVAPGEGPEHLPPPGPCVRRTP
jgi:adenylate cyclase